MSLTIQLDDETAEVVEGLAALEHRSADDVVREALSAYVQTGSKRLRNEVGQRPAAFVDQLDRELTRLAALPPNWDAEGALPIARQIISAARHFVARLPSDLVSVPAVVPMSKGNLQFEWHNGPRSLELEFESPETIHSLKWHPEQGIEEEEIFPASDVTKAESLMRWFSGSVTNA